MPPLTIPQAFALAQQHHQAGRLAEAEPLYRQILAVMPRHADALHFLGMIASQTGRNDVAVELMRQSLALAPRNAVFHDNLGTVLRELGRLDEAIACSQRALALDPNEAVTHNNLGNALRDQFRLSEAISCFDRALVLRPDYPEAVNNRGIALAEAGRLSEALAAHRRALELKPEWPDARSSLLLNLHYFAGIDPREIAAEHRRWGDIHARPLKARIESHANDPTPERRLRIGYVSPDFRNHPVAFFIEALLARHDRLQVEVFCYANMARDDVVTARLRQHADHWRSIAGMSDENAAALIRADRIDVLVDLAGHTADHRLLVFARKPAPVQVTWLGYCDTTGMDVMDFRMTDAHADPVGVADELHTERLVRLPCAWCYTPQPGVPEVSPLPAAELGVVTFGCFNNLAKVNDEVLASWAEVLGRVPGSRLLLKTGALREALPRELLLERLARDGVSAERVEFSGALPTLAAHLEAYRRVDVALDPFPYHGTTTTCEALWMGVPVVTLAGAHHAARVGVSLLHAVGLEEFIARDRAKYVELAVRLGSDLARLAELRATLRERMKRSRLLDARAFARDMEAAYREMWREWCAKPGA